MVVIFILFSVIPFFYYSTCYRLDTESTATHFHFHTAIGTFDYNSPAWCIVVSFEMPIRCFTAKRTRLQKFTFSVVIMDFYIGSIYCNIHNYLLFSNQLIILFFASVTAINLSLSPPRSGCVSRESLR